MRSASFSGLFETPRRLRLWALGLAVLALGFCFGCDDGGAKHYRSAHGRYEELVRAGRPAKDAAFDEVLRELERVPAGARDHPRAMALRENIRRSRAPKLERPLVTPYGALGEEPEVAGKKAECEQLAKELGAAPAGEREAIRAKLVLCQTQQHEIEELRHSRAHPDHR